RSADHAQHAAQVVRNHPPGPGSRASLFGETGLPDLGSRAGWMMHARAEIPTQRQHAPPSFIDQAFSRAAGVRRSEGNAVRVLHDAAENYPAWLDAIGRARHYIYFESYILRDDAAGNRFADALIARSRDGIVVRVLYDWLGAIGKSPASFWRRLRDAGVH